MRASRIMFIRATAARRVSEQILDRVHTKFTEFKVNPFGLLQLRVSDCSPKFVPLDHSVYPDGDRVVVSHCSGCQLDQHRMDFVPTKGKNPDVLSLSCVNSEHAEYCGCIVQVPTQMTLDISASGDADVKISNLEPAQCHISTEYSSVHLHKVKTGKASIFANNGSVEITGNLIGNMSIKTGVKGFVRADRLQGSSIKIDTFEGPINCNAIYGENVALSSREGNIKTKHLHGDVKIWTTGGNVDIGSLDGSLELSSGRGHSNVNVAKSDKVRIHAMDGNVKLGLADTVQSQIHLESPSRIETGDLNLRHEVAPHQNVPNDSPSKSRVLGQLNDGAVDCDAQVQVIATKGTINLHTISWISSLKLGLPDENPASQAR